MKPILVSFKHKRDVSRGKQYHPISSRILQWEMEMDLLRLKKNKTVQCGIISFYKKPHKKNFCMTLTWQISSKT